MSKPMIRIHNTETDEIIDREMTDAEFEEYQARKMAFDQAEAARLAEEAEKAAKKAELLAKLGITEDDAKLLLS